VIESLEIALEASIPDSVLQHAEIQIDEMPGLAQCRSCGHEFEADDFYVLCPECQSIEIDFLTGKELLLKSIVIS
jgi:hydrogenase nickel incorporation protein HypA/HybF